MYIKSQYCFYSQTTLSDVFSENSKENFIKSIKNAEPFQIKMKRAVKEAAVLVPFCLVNKNPCVLLTVRSRFVGRNKGDISFPGGMREVTDEDAVHVALREAEEEIGMPMDPSKIWTTMKPFPSSGGGIAVTPVIAFIGSISDINFKINSNEVESLFTPTLQSFCNSDNWRYTQYNNKYILPVYTIKDHHIWGLTASIMHVVLQALLPQKYKNNFIFFPYKEITKQST